MESILSVARQNGLFVVEDACQACGATYEGKPVGSLGDIGCFSFNFFKTLACGEGGAVITNKKELYERSLILHDPGIPYNKRYAHLKNLAFAGFNFRNNEILSSILRVQLGRLDGWVTQLREVREQYRETLQNISEVSLLRQNHQGEGLNEHFFLSFLTADKARLFAEKARAANIPLLTPIEDPQHICFGWHVLLNGRGGHVDTQNPLGETTKSTFNQSMCPQTKHWASRAVGLSLSPASSTGTALERLKVVRTLLS